MSLCMLLACNSPKSSAPETEIREMEELSKEEEKTDTTLRTDGRSSDGLLTSLRERISIIKAEFKSINSATDFYQDTIPFMDQSTEGGN